MEDPLTNELHGRAFIEKLNIRSAAQEIPRLPLCNLEVHFYEMPVLQLHKKLS
jgi:hypothetical protein